MRLRKGLLIRRQRDGQVYQIEELGNTTFCPGKNAAYLRPYGLSWDRVRSHWKTHDAILREFTEYSP